METLRHSSHEKSVLRLRASLKLARFLAAGELNIEGYDNLEFIDTSRPLIVASTHITDVDMPIAASVVADKLDLSITGTSLFNNVSSGFIRKVFISAPGKKNFKSIEYNIDNRGNQRPAVFNYKSFNEIINSIGDGKKPIVAAHNPVRDGKLPERPGIAVPYLASATGADILPVAVQFENSDNKLGMADHRLYTLLAREAIRVSIGQPIRIDLPENSLEYSSKEEFVRSSQYLRQQGRLVMSHLADLLN